MSGYQVDSYAQLITAVTSVVSGVALCLLYDLLRLIRYARRPSTPVAFIQDVAWWVAATLVTGVILLVRCNGEIRFFVLINMAIGFFVCRLTLSVIILKLGQPIIAFIKRCCNAIVQGVFRPFTRMLTQTGSNLLKKLKNFVKKAKKLLKHCVNVVYNFFVSWVRMTIAKRSSENDV